MHLAPELPGRVPGGGFAAGAAPAGLGDDGGDGVVPGYLDPLVRLHAVLAQVLLAVRAPGLGKVVVFAIL